MSEEDSKRYSDPELERFVRENRAMIGKLLGEEKRMFMETLSAEKGKVDTMVSEHKARAKDAVRSVADALADRDVQRHFTSAGLELFMGIEALIKASPLNGVMDDIMGRKPDSEAPDAGDAPAEGGHITRIPISGPEQGETDRK